jgi:hypothetical protein
MFAPLPYRLTVALPQELYGVALIGSRLMSNYSLIAIPAKAEGLTEALTFEP